MSLYNLMHGFDSATLFILPMLGKHPDEYPRFRDCFARNGEIEIFTRVGGGNRESYEKEIKELQSMPGYLRDEDKEPGSTFATFFFAVPALWQEDYKKIVDGSLEISDAYKQEIYRIYPKLKEKLEQLF